MPDFDKYSKAECDYGPGSWPEECSTCSHFNGRSACRIVVGAIDPEMWCKFHVYVKGQEHLADEGAESIEGSPSEGRLMGDVMSDPKISLKRRQEIADKYTAWTRKEQQKARATRQSKDWCPVCKQYLSTPHRHFTSGEV